MSGDSEQRSAKGGTISFDTPMPDTDAFGRPNNPTSGGQKLYGPPADEGVVQVDATMNGRGGFDLGGGKGGLSASEAFQQKLKNAGIDPGTFGGGGTAAPTVNLPPAPTLPTITPPAAPGLPTYQPPGPPPGLPDLSPPAEMPTTGSPETTRAGFRVVDAITARRGRTSTFLTTPSGRTPAVPLPAAPKPPMRRTGAGVFGT